MSIARRALRTGTELLAGWPFPVFMITALLSATVLLAVMLVTPMEGTALEQFADDFRRWCFGAGDDGGLGWGYVVGMLTSPLWLAGFTLLVWWAPLREVYQVSKARMAWAIAPALALVGVLAAGLSLVAEPAAAAGFPAEALRTAHEPPELSLTDQNGELVTLDALRGQVVVVTAVYSRCGRTCPMILAQARSVLDRLPDEVRADVRLVAISLDPGHDTPSDMATMRTSHRLAEDGVHLVTGEADRVDAVLDGFDFSRRRNDATGEIDHANMFVVIDKSGRIAYRFSLGDRQEAWLVEAITLLARERASTQPTRGAGKA